MRNERIGLVGYHVEGEINQNIAERADVYRWLIRPHPVLKMLPLPEDVDYIVCPLGLRTEEFVRSVNIVMFVGIPCYGNLMELCYRYKRRIVRIPTNFLVPIDDDGWESFTQDVRKGRYELQFT